jgi:tetratricopeptide (TPR) repeat protein
MSLPIKGIVLLVALTAAVSSGRLLADDFSDAVAASMKRDFDTAIRLFSKAIEANPNNVQAFWGRGAAYQSLGELDKAIADYDETIRLDRTSVLAFINRGSTWHIKGNFEKALADFNEAIRLDPKQGTAFVRRGSVWYTKGELDKSLADFDEAIRLNPKNSDAYIYRGFAWQQKGDFEKAIGDYTEAIRLDPKSTAALNGRGWIRATCRDEKYRDGAKAVNDATRAGELSDWKDFAILDTIAAAYAEAGKFDKAVEWQAKAIDLAPDDQKEDFGTRLKLYQEGKPYREEPSKK